ncbi:MAG: hypothetical protein ACTSXA_04965 [Candidatus Heimdallarchaeota archaeon]
MNKKIPLVVIVFLGAIIASSTCLLLFSNNFLNSNYLLDKEVPGIVKGTSKMVDTERYFTNYELGESKARLDLVCNNSENLQISIGYKRPTEALAIADDPIKERMIWNCRDVSPKHSIDYKFETESIASDSNRIVKEWDLTSLGFNLDEYVKSDERIWFLRIKDISGGPYGYEINTSIEVNGTTYEYPEYYPHSHNIEEFKLVFDNLIFETQLYPFFDGSTEIIIPIRGVNHELAIEDEKTAYEVKGISKNDYTTTQTGTYGGNLWVIVFGTGEYVYIGSSDLLYPPMECRSFILGCAKPSIPSKYQVGIIDYGWRVVYCMDGNSRQTDIATTTQTDDNFLEDMFDFADNQLGSTGKLIVFVVGHGKVYAQEHYTMTGKTHLIFFFWINAFTCSEYKVKVDDITTDGTHVFLWISACHGNGLDSFQSWHHNYKLESWSFRPVHEGTPSNGRTDDGTYQTFYWLHHPTYSTPLSECSFFFHYAAQGVCEYTVTEMFPSIEFHYNYEYDSVIYQQSTWGSYYFYINWGY